MTREDAKDLALSILVIVDALLLADNIWLHVRCARSDDAIAALADRVERHINPPPAPEGASFSDKAKQTLEKVKSAAAKGYQAVRQELEK